MLYAELIWLADVGAYSLFGPVGVEVDWLCWIKHSEHGWRCEGLFGVFELFIGFGGPYERFHLILGEFGSFEKIGERSNDRGVMLDEAMDGIGEAEEGS